MGMTIAEKIIAAAAGVEDKQIVSVKVGKEGERSVIFGDVANHHVADLTDITPREFLVLALLAVGALGMGLYPLPFTEIMHSSVEELLRHVAASKIL